MNVDMQRNRQDYITEGCQWAIIADGIHDNRTLVTCAQSPVDWRTVECTDHRSV